MADVPTLLRLDSSASGDASVTRRLTDAFEQAWRARGASYDVVARDLHADPVPHLETSALHWAPGTRPEGSVPAEAAALQQTLVDELLAADVLVVGVPVYNYAAPSTLKAWIDRVHVPGWTTGPTTRPLAGRPAVLATASGIAYDEGSPTEGHEHAVPALEVVLGTALGMWVEVVAARYTLAAEVPELAPMRHRGEQELTDALARLADLGATLT